MTAFRVIFLPGIVLPAELAYGALLEALGTDVEPAVKDLDVYATAEPPEDYGLEHEIAGVLREAGARGWERFHLVGYSGGGAVSLAVAAASPERLSSIALLEPAWAGRRDQTATEQAVWLEHQRLERLPAEELMPAFTRLALKPGVPLPSPPPGKARPWMAKRPAGIRAIQGAFARDDIDGDALRSFERPVYFALGALSNPDHYGEIANVSAECSPTSSSRSSRSVITSTRRIAESPNASRARSGRSGGGRNRPERPRSRIAPWPRPLRAPGRPGPAGLRTGTSP